MTTEKTRQHLTLPEKDILLCDQFVNKISAILTSRFPILDKDKLKEYLNGNEPEIAELYARLQQTYGDNLTPVLSSLPDKKKDFESFVRIEEDNLFELTDNALSSPTSGEAYYQICLSFLRSMAVEFSFSPQMRNQKDFTALWEAFVMSIASSLVLYNSRDDIPLNNIPTHLRSIVKSQLQQQSATPNPLDDVINRPNNVRRNAARLAKVATGLIPEEAKRIAKMVAAASFGGDEGEEKRILELLLEHDRASLEEGPLASSIDERELHAAAKRKFLASEDLRNTFETMLGLKEGQMPILTTSN